MKKITLNVDALRVESFEVAEPEKPRGTILAHGPTGEESCGESYCFGECTNYDQCSAVPTCQYSCNSGPCWCLPQG
jgi:hypothetical protein